MSEKMTKSERLAVLRSVAEALQEQQYDPIRQIRGFLLSGDPTYIPDYKNARAQISEIDRADLLDDLLITYLSKGGSES